MTGLTELMMVAVRMAEGALLSLGGEGLLWRHGASLCPRCGKDLLHRVGRGQQPPNAHSQHDRQAEWEYPCTSRKASAAPQSRAAHTRSPCAATTSANPSRQEGSKIL